MIQVRIRVLFEGLSFILSFSEILYIYFMNQGRAQLLWLLAFKATAKF